VGGGGSVCLPLRLGYSLSIALNCTNLVQGEHGQILGGIGAGYGKVGDWVFTVKSRKAAKQGKINQKFLLSAYIVIQVIDFWQNV